MNSCLVPLLGTTSRDIQYPGLNLMLQPTTGFTDFDLPQKFAAPNPRVDGLSTQTDFI
jgi:hypothetical protein